MAGPADVLQRAHLLDQKTTEQRELIDLDAPASVFRQIRAYLFAQDRDMATGNDVYNSIKASKASHGLFVIGYGPQFDKGPDPAQFHFRSGSRLSFGITLEDRNGRSGLVAFRFHLEAPAEIQTPRFLRFELRNKHHDSPLQEPICHVHPGSNHFRLPLPAMSPFDVLDRIFYVVEPAFLAALQK